MIQEIDIDIFILKDSLENVVLKIYDFDNSVNKDLLDNFDYYILVYCCGIVLSVDPLLEQNSVTYLDELFIAIPAAIAIACGKEDYLFRIALDIDEITADVCDIYTMLNTILLIPFLVVILRDPTYIEDTLFQWLTDGLMAGACFIVA
ncbi:12278_t:CDS:2, partial [Ambispora leptoticha]